MVEELQIEGFRCFDRFQIAGLRRLNLIGGKNSTGKSSLLEAMQFFLQPDLGSLKDLLAWRDQLQSARQLPVWTEETVHPLFHRSIPASSRKFTLKSADREVCCRAALHGQDREGNWTEVAESLNGGPKKPVLKVESIRTGRVPFFFVPLDGSIEFDSPTHSALKASEAFLRYARLDRQRVIHARARAYDSDSLSEMLEEMLGTPRYDDITRVLGWIIPDVKHIFTKGQGDGRSIHVQVSGVSSPQPLASFGDGAVRLTGIVLATVLAKGGFCLIDEIENGIHYSLFEELWPLLNRLSLELGVQILATTHSKDCVDGFAEACKSTEFDGAFFRLQRRTGEGITVVRMDNATYFSKVAGTPYEIR